MRFSFPIEKTEKTDDGRLLIEGVATSEALDLQGDILDYEGSKRAFEKWRGNLREAHDPKKPVGKAIEIIPDDIAKTITVRAFISAGAKDTQEKVLDGTLEMFSIGGGRPTKTSLQKVGGKAVRRVLEWPMTELSLVDVGANPDAAVSVAKAAGIEDEEEPPIEEPKPEEPPPAEETKPQAPQLTETQMTELVEKVTDAVLAALEAKAKGKIEAPPPAAEPPAEKAATPEVTKTDGMAAYDVRAALDCLAGLEMLRSCETYEVMAGEPEPPEQLALLDSAIKSLKAFVASEAKELVEGEPGAAPEMKAARPIIIKVEQPVDLTPLLERLDSLQKSAPVPDPRLDDVVAGIGSIPATVATELSKAMGDLKAAFSGEVKALREGEIAQLAKGMGQVLSMPVPGRSPIRNLEAVREQMQKSAPSETNKANLARELAQGAPTAVREYLLHEASLISRG